jgi:hypothetical protein
VARADVVDGHAEAHRGVIRERALERCEVLDREALGDLEDDDDRDLPIAKAPIVKSSGIPRNVFGRAEDEITSDFALPGTERRPRASDPPSSEVATQPVPAQPAGSASPWQPLSDDEATGEALLSSLKRPENASDGEPGPGRPGLN